MARAEKPVTGSEGGAVRRSPSSRPAEFRPQRSLAFEGEGVAFWEWRHGLAPLFDVAVRSPEGVAAFRAKLQAYRFGGLLLARLDGGPLILRRSATTIARSSGIDHVLVMVHRAGCRDQGGQWAAEAGDITLLDLSRPSFIRFDRFACDLLSLPHSLLPLPGDMGGYPAVAHLRDGTPICRHLRGHLETLFETLPAMAGDDAEALVPATAGFLAAALARGEGAARPEADRPAPLLLRIRQHIESHLSSPHLSPVSIEKAFSLSRSSLYRLFEPLGGVAEYIRRRRLAHCFVAITAPAQRGRRIADIAFAAGFSNEAAFSRLFSATFGLSPRLARLAAASKVTASARKPTMSPLEEFRQWLYVL